jgi:hypothetical protein
MYYKTITSPNEARTEISVKHVKSLQAYRLNILPYAPDTMLSPFDGVYITLEKGRMNKRKLERWEKLIDQHASKIAKWYWTQTRETLRENILMLHA